MTACKTVIITGGNSGIGFACAEKLASSEEEWHVVLACRNAERAAAAVRRIIDRTAGANVEAMTLDLASLDSVRDFVKTFAARRLPPLRALICNAAMVTMKEMSYTTDGFESMFGVNHLGHFLLANLLLRHLQAPARIVFVSSDVHDPKATRIGRFVPPRYLEPQHLAWPARSGEALGPWMSRYATSKLCNILCAYELDRRMRRQGLSTRERPITVNAYTPYVVPTTGVGMDMNPVQKFMLSQRWFVRMLGSDLETEECAGGALARLVLDPKLEGVSGKYFQSFQEIPSSEESHDERKAKELWEGSAALVNLTKEEALLC
jgi:NAD(P)-dependent dehydrogenase (short-subunit alcohol dehydrogenase family)